MEQGRHESLLALNGLYAALWRRQTANNVAGTVVKETITAKGGSWAQVETSSRGSS